MYEISRIRSINKAYHVIFIWFLNRFTGDVISLTAGEREGEYDTSANTESDGNEILLTRSKDLIPRKAKMMTSMLGKNLGKDRHSSFLLW